MNENFIAENAKLISSSHGLGVKIYRNAELRESIIGNDVQVGDDSILLKCNLVLPLIEEILYKNQKLEDLLIRDLIL
jgi:NDP-sugar pyrophosphorylase family protein